MTVIFLVTSPRIQDAFSIGTSEKSLRANVLATLAVCPIAVLKFGQKLLLLINLKNTFSKITDSVYFDLTIIKVMNAIGPILSKD